MKLKKQLIQMLTEPKADFSAIADVLRICPSTARKACQGRSLRYETARTIVVALDDYPLNQLFRRPLKPFERWLHSPAQTKLRDPSLTPAERLAVQRSLWKYANPEKVRKQHRKAYMRRRRRMKQRTQVAVAETALSV